MRIAGAWMAAVLVGAALLLGSGGCDDCGRESIPHCPGPNGAAECIDGRWQCVLYDAAMQLPPDLAQSRD